MSSTTTAIKWEDPTLPNPVGRPSGLRAQMEAQLREVAANPGRWALLLTNKETRKGACATTRTQSRTYSAARRVRVWFKDEFPNIEIVGRRTASGDMGIFARAHVVTAAE